MNYPEGTICRFWSKVDKSGGPDACWPWLGTTKPGGYGSFFVTRIPPGSKGKKIYANAHRLAYELTCGPIAPGLFACHRCDTPSCCNPNHIFLGTPRENVQDAVAKGRINYHNNGKKSGGKITHGSKLATLTDEQVVALLNDYDNGALLADLAAKYGCHKAVASEIVWGKRYKWIPEVNQARIKPHERYGRARRIARLKAA